MAKKIILAFILIVAILTLMVACDSPQEYAPPPPEGRIHAQGDIGDNLSYRRCY